ncbi:MAG: serine--tRNA ligase [Methylophilaceae bacterium]
MIDINLLRDDLAAVEKKLSTRGFNFDSKLFSSLETQRKELQVKTQELQESRNQLSKQIGIEKSKGGDTTDIMNEVSKVSSDLKDLETNLLKIQNELQDYLLTVPNLPHDSVPVGKNENDNQVVKESGTIKTYDFEVKDHVDVGFSHGLDFDLGAKLSGARFTFMRGAIARLHRAIAQFMLDTQINDHGYEECYTPFLVNADSLLGTGQLPKFEEDLFSTSRGDDDRLFLIPTGEVPLTNLARDLIVDEKELPIKLTALTPCFRSEAGSYGKDTRGMIRQHQFEKVEMVQIVHPDHSYKALDEMVQHAENILSKLELPYRVVSLCTGDMGFGASKTYDLEVWLPSQQTYREISSVSNCEAFQSRRMKARFKDSNKKNHLLHTLNGSGLAVGRALVAILENYQESNGDIGIPKVLQAYMGGIQKISIET